MIRTLLFCVCLASLPASAGAARRVPVTVVTDEVFEQLPQWRGVIQSVFNKATDDFPQLVGWDLKIEDWQTVDPGRADTYSSALENIAKELKFENGILVYFAGVQYAQETRRGFALLDKRVLAVALDSRRDMTFTLRHELGHALGLPHCPGKSIMAEVATQRTWDFSPLAKDALNAVRGMALGNAPLFFGADLAVLKSVHAAWTQAGYADDRILTRLEAREAEPATTP